MSVVVITTSRAKEQLATVRVGDTE